MPPRKIQKLKTDRSIRKNEDGIEQAVEMNATRGTWRIW
jgi:hypothetical protein